MPNTEKYHSFNWLSLEEEKIKFPHNGEEYVPIHPVHSSEAGDSEDLSGAYKNSVCNGIESLQEKYTINTPTPYESKRKWITKYCIEKQIRLETPSDARIMEQAAQNYLFERKTPQKSITGAEGFNRVTLWFIPVKYLIKKPTEYEKGIGDCIDCIGMCFK